MGIEYHTYQQIDKKKWDECISRSANGLLYAYSFYLDAMAANWDAVILNDYEAVMPLVWNKKLGIRYLYQPPFMQQLGIFSKEIITEKVIDDFIEITKTEFRFAEIFLNTANIIPGAVQALNLILPLNCSYEKIRANYKNDLLKNLAHSKKFELSYVHTENYDEAINTYVKEYSARIPHVKNKDYQAFRELCAILAKKNMLIVRQVFSPKNELLAIGLFLKDERRIYNIMSTVLPAGKTAEANHFLLDELIKEFANTIAFLDFEGSDIAGIASFYKKFGAIAEPYAFLRYNNLPWFFRFLKK